MPNFALDFNLSQFLCIFERIEDSDSKNSESSKEIIIPDIHNRNQRDQIQPILRFIPANFNDQQVPHSQRMHKSRNIMSCEDIGQEQRHC